MDDQVVKQARLQPISGGSNIQITAPAARMASARSVESIARLQSEVIDLTQQPAPSGESPSILQCVEKLLGMRFLSDGDLDFRLGFDEMHIIHRLLHRVIKPNRDMVNMHQLWASTGQADTPIAAFRDADCVLFNVTVDHKIGLTVISRPEKLATYHCEEPMVITQQKRSKYIIKVNPRAFGTGVYVITILAVNRRPVRLYDSGVWALFFIECYLRFIRPDRIETNVETLPYRYAAMLSQHLPRFKEEISLSIERYATVAIEKIHSDALERNLRWEEQQSSLQDTEPKEEESSQPDIETIERREGSSFVPETILRPTSSLKAELPSENLYDASPQKSGRKYGCLEVQAGNVRGAEIIIVLYIVYNPGAFCSEQRHIKAITISV